VPLFDPAIFDPAIYDIGGDAPPPPPVAVVGGGHWFPRRRKALRDEPLELPSDVAEEVPVVAAPKSRRKIVLADLIPKQDVAQISALDIEEAVQAFNRRARQRREDEELLLLH
jgi:hypothetical protein